MREIGCLPTCVACKTHNHVALLYNRIDEAHTTLGVVFWVSYADWRRNVCNGDVCRIDRRKYFLWRHVGLTGFVDCC